MTASHRWSHASETCRLEWRPSRLLAAALVLLGLLAAGAAVVSEMPARAAWLLAAACLLHGISNAWRSLQPPAQMLVWNGRSGVVTLDGTVLAVPSLSWRGPIAVLRWRGPDARARTLVWWPDTLPAPRRRELRLAAGEGAAAAAPGSMAP